MSWRVRGLKWTVLGSLVALLHGCGSSSSSSSSSGTSGSSDAEAFIQDYCGTVGTCCGALGKTFDADRCSGNYREQAKTNTLDPKQAATCLDGLHAAKAAGTLCDWRTSVRNPCLTVFTGHKEPGESCVITIPVECAPSTKGDAVCVAGTGGQVCGVRIDGEEGDSPCISTREANIGYGNPWTGQAPSEGYFCDTSKDLYCDPTTKACTRAPALGAACVGSMGGHSCGASAYCDKTTAVCVARPASGDDCSAPGTLCALGTYCDDATHRCLDQLADGAACSTNASCTTGACIQSVCGGEGTPFFSVMCK